MWEPCHKVVLAVNSDSLSIGELEALLRMEPDESWNKGDPFTIAGRRKINRFSRWSIAESVDTLQEIPDALKKLRHRTDAIGSNIVELAGRSDILLQFFITTEETAFDLSFDIDQLRYWTALGAGLDSSIAVTPSRQPHGDPRGRPFMDSQYRAVLAVWSNELSSVELETILQMKPDWRWNKSDSPRLAGRPEAHRSSCWSIAESVDELSELCEGLSRLRRRIESVAPNFAPIRGELNIRLQLQIVTWDTVFGLGLGIEELRFWVSLGVEIDVSIVVDAERAWHEQTVHADSSRQT